MDWILVKMLRYKIYRAEKKKKRSGNILEKAYENMIKNFKNTIMYLEANK